MFCSGPLAGHTTSDILLSVEEVSHKPFRFFWVGVGEWGVVVLRANLLRGRYSILTECGFIHRTAEFKECWDWGGMDDDFLSS